MEVTINSSLVLVRKECIQRGLFCMLDLNSACSMRIEICSEKNYNLEAILSTLAIFIEGFVLCDFPRSPLLN